MSTLARTAAVVSAPGVATAVSLPPSLAVGDHLHVTPSVMSTMQQLAVAQHLHQQQQQQVYIDDNNNNVNNNNNGAGSTNDSRH